MVDRRFACRGCRSADVHRLVDLGALPASDDFPPVGRPGDDPRWPLELWRCSDCTLVQLGPVEPQLPAPPLAVESETSRRHAASSVSRLLIGHPHLAGATFVEFASHHGGRWTNDLVRLGCRDVTDTSERADLVIDVHGLAHEPDVLTSLEQRTARLSENGLFVLEFHHLLQLVRGSQFDTIRHGHWSYLSLTAIERLLAPLALAPVDAQPAPVYGGSLIVSVHATAGRGNPPSVQTLLSDEEGAGLVDGTGVAGLGVTARRAASALNEYLVGLRQRGRSVAGYGAPSKAAVLLGLAQVGPELLPYTVDAAAGKHGRRIPGCNVPIRPVAVLREERPDVVLILTWDIAEEVVQQLESENGWEAEYVVPLPSPHAIS